MNWRAKYEEIKVGDMVKCITPINPIKNSDGNGGCGWKEGDIFQVDRIDGGAVKIYWRKHGSGCWEGWVEKI